MRFSVSNNHIYLSAECEAEKLQIRDAVSQLERFKLAHTFWGADSLHIYVKGRDQYNDELELKERKS